MPTMNTSEATHVCEHCRDTFTHQPYTGAFYECLCGECMAELFYGPGKHMYRYRFNGGEWRYCAWEPIVPADDPEPRDCSSEVCKMGGLPAELLRDGDGLTTPPESK